MFEDDITRCRQQGRHLVFPTFWWVSLTWYAYASLKHNSLGAGEVDANDCVGADCQYYVIFLFNNSPQDIDDDDRTVRAKLLLTRRGIVFMQGFVVPRLFNYSLEAFRQGLSFPLRVSPTQRFAVSQPPVAQWSR